MENYDILHIGDAGYKTLLTDKFKNRKPHKKHKIKELRAFIPGTIDDVFVSEGQKIKKGDILMTLEAMKMKNRIIAPVDGSVKNLKVKKGDTVIKNELLVVLK